jgi:phenylpropionate dioxygenase-like ring-hydroxylating dioxygenase large terminal subunit
MSTERLASIKTAAADAAPTMKPLEYASTLAPRFYIEPEIYAAEVELIMRSSWISIGRIEQAAKPGDFFSYDLLGEPLVVVRDMDGVLRVMSRVCRHRGFCVVEGAGNRNSLQCQYHLWTYGLDGRLLGAPEMQQAAGFDRASCRLPEIRHEEWQGWIFVNLDSSALPLAPELTPLSKILDAYGVADWVALAPLVFDSPWNWKVMVDNFTESYHHAGIHPDTLQPITPAATTWAEDSCGPFAILHNPTRGEPMPTAMPVSPALSAEQLREFIVVAVFPFHLFAVSPDSMQYYQIQPLGPEHIMLRIFNCVPRAAAAEEYAELHQHLAALVNRIHQQDIPACTGIQAGYRSRFAAQGRYSHLEKALWQFHRYVLGRLIGEERRADPR